jgi:hypothetical protein
MLRLDNSKRSCLATCPRKAYWTYIRHLEPATGSTALRYGSVTHSAFDGLYSYIQENGWKQLPSAIAFATLCAKDAWEEYNSKGQHFYDDYKSLPNLLTGILQYVNHFSNDSSMLKILSTETAFEVTIHPTLEEYQLHKEIDTFQFTGIIDLEVELSGLPWLLDYKTTSQAISMQSQRIQRSPQFIGYTFGAKHWLSTPPEGTLVVFCHISAYKSKTTGEYVTPKYDFDRFPQIYSEHDLTQWRRSLVKRAAEWLHNEFYDDWPMEYDSCYQFGACQYISLCEQPRPKDDVQLRGFIEREPWDPVQNAEKNRDRKRKLLSQLHTAKESL